MTDTTVESTKPQQCCDTCTCTEIHRSKPV